MTTFLRRHLIRSSAFILLLSLIGYSAFAQITFEKGYFVRNDGTRTEGLIKNMDWKNNPSEILYKTESSSPEIVQIIDISEFGIYGQSTYKTLTVNIDRSVFKIGETYDRNPNFKKETLALKVLVTGTANLYYYEDRDLIRFFFSTGDSTVEQLVYKEYMVEAQRTGKNELYKQQLWLNVRCGDVTQASVTKLQYDRNALVNYFQKFNLCSGDQPVLEKKARRKSLFIKLSPGVGFSALTVEYMDQFLGFTRKFEDNLSYHVGAEAEMILPFNKNKWGILFEPSFNTFTGEEDETGKNYEVKINTVEIGFGVRHYFFLNQNSKIFLNAMLICYVPLDEALGYLNLSTSSNYGAAFGAGYGYKRLSAEIRYYLSHETIGNYGSWSAQQTKSIFVLGYRIF
jgi:hypothetical protein